MKLITMQRNLTPLTFSEFSFWSCTAVPFLYKICWRSRTYFIAPFLYHGTAEAFATDCPYSLHRVDFQPLAISYRTPLVFDSENAPSSRFTWGDIALCYSELNRPRLSPSTFSKSTRLAPDGSKHPPPNASD